MIRSTRIPYVLNRICDETIVSALLVTADGELLGASTRNGLQKNPESFGTLLADIALDYHRLGEELATTTASSGSNISTNSDDGGAANQNRSKSFMQCLLIEMDLGLVGVAACSGIDCFVIAVAKPDAPPGMVKARLQSLAIHVQESLSTLTEAT